MFASFGVDRSATASSEREGGASASAEATPKKRIRAKAKPQKDHAKDKPKRIRTGRPSSHSGRYKRGARKTSWQNLADRLKQTTCAVTLLELEQLKSELQWERARRIALEGAEQNERDAYSQLALARSAVNTFRRRRLISREVWSQLLRELGGRGGDVSAGCQQPAVEGAGGSTAT